MYKFSAAAGLFQVLVFFIFIVSCNRSDNSREDVNLYLPADLEVELWAESPLFHNPTNIDIDARGRVWVTEAVNYRNFNHDTITMMHRAGGDRVMILEDTNHDGKADVSKVFVQDKDLVAPMGIAVIGNKVYVSCSPRLIVYTDNDGDDKPDHKEILLNGFGGFDHDHGLHAVVGGPDQLLYFNAGNAGPHIVTDRSGWTLRAGSLYTGGTPYNKENEGNMKSDDGEVYVGGVALSIDRSGKNMQVAGHNFRNAVELTIDSKGDIWQNDNDDQVLTCRTTWLMEKGNAGYFSEDGTRYWQADQRPWQSTFAAHWHQDDPGVMPAGDNAGAGSPTGIVLNEGNALGENYDGMLLSADAGRNVIFGYKPGIKGSGYDLGKRENLVTSLQKDNINYVWNDSLSNSQQEKWFRPSDVAIGTDGAIYISDWYDPVVGGHQMNDGKGYGRIYRVTKKGAVTTAPDIDVSTLEGQLKAFASPAINVRHAALEKLVERGDTIFNEVLPLLDTKNEYLRYRTIWLLSKLGDKGRKKVEELLKDNDAQTRVVAYRALRKITNDILPYASAMANDQSPFVRREIAVSLTNIPYIKSKNILLQLANNFDGEDRWYLETIGKAVKGNESDFYQQLVKQFQPGADTKNWDKRFTSFLWRLHPPTSVNRIVQWAKNSDNEKEKAAALTALSFINTKEAANAMLSFTTDTNGLLKEHATYWLSFRHGNNWFALLDWNQINIKTNALAAAPAAAIANELSPSDTLNAAEIAGLQPNNASGKTVFQNYCATCHRFGDDGKNIGPELSAIGSKFDKKTLLESIIAPSEGIVFGYETWIVTASGGEAYYGFLMGENKNTLVLKDLAGNQHIIPSAEVKSKKKQDKSPMPDPYSLGLTKQQLADVAGYLQTEPD